MRFSKSLASTEGVPFYTAIAQLKAGELVVALSSMCLLPGRAFEPAALLRHPSAMLEGFGGTVWLLALCLLADGWMSALVVRSLSSVAKLIAKCMSLIVLYLAALACGSEQFALPRFILAFLVVSGTVQFAYASQGRHRRSTEAEPLTEAERSQIEAAFRRFDSDGDGGIDMAEFDEMACNLGAKLAGPQLRQAFEEMDLNGDGRICLDEFRSFWESHPRFRGYSAPGLPDQEAEVRRGAHRVFHRTPPFFCS